MSQIALARRPIQAGGNVRHFSQRIEATGTGPVHTHPLYLARHGAVDDARRLAFAVLGGEPHVPF